MAQAVHGRHQDTDLDRDAGYDNRIDAEDPKGLIEIGLEECAEPPLG